MSALGRGWGWGGGLYKAEESPQLRSTLGLPRQRTLLPSPQSLVKFPCQEAGHTYIRILLVLMCI